MSTRRVFAAARLLRDLIAYGLASGAALALDYGLLLLCQKTLGLPYLVAAAIGFSGGLALVYALSVAIVFRDRRSVRPASEFSVFFAIGLAGLLLTEALMFIFVGRLGFDPAFAKIPTAGCVFLFNFTARRALLFSAPTSTAKASA
ncbi:GtrA family protein [Methylosinus sp. H3A]|uniref:GtrA family protein n=1 Tax=Methylosinus sp. H3A TaxID=2785786 RepID=UPI0018C341BD|nr:GtrA family protein [Methylosinus sp. H3A]MBG0809594.1 GtrA family protein [Methylosinus sp. H3A]